MAGPPNREATVVARPSPSRVRWRPGSATKFLPTVEEMAQMSPTCSIMVAREMGMMVIMEVTSRLPSKSLPKMDRAVLFQTTGRPIQSASPTSWARFARAAGSTIMANT